MKIVNDGEALEIEGTLFNEGDEDEFMVPANLVVDSRLSDIPQGYRIILCDRIIGDGDLYPKSSGGTLEHSISGEFFAHCEFPFFCGVDKAQPDAVASEVKRKGENALQILSGEQFTGRISGLKLDCHEEIAFVSFQLSLPNQSIEAAELFVSSVEERVNSDSDRQTLFLCHASEDKGFVDKLDAALQRDAQLAWYDKRSIFVGDSIVSEINSGLLGARFLIAVLSPRSVLKPWVLRELDSTMMRSLGGEEIRILPVLIEDCQPPPLISDYKFADFRSSFTRGYSELLAAIRKS